ncbi:MAG TPA: hypothetical protein VGI98_08220 [Candidatus Limnocylindrales bacterium]|jgi:hypothetical protein
MQLRYRFAALRPIVIALVAGLALASSRALVASAHVVEHAGGYSLELGWHVEPTYVGYPNAVEVTITDSAGQSVTDLGEDDLHVVVTSGSQTSQPLSFEPAFDLGEGDGTPGQYIAKILPTAPGDYTFHVTGAIHGTSVDVSVTSSDQTFDPAIGTTDIEFPNQLPDQAEVATHLDRLDGRVADAAGSASDASEAAVIGIVVGSVVGGVGVIVGLVALVMARRAGRRGSAA